MFQIEDFLHVMSFHVWKNWQFERFVIFSRQCEDKKKRGLTKAILAMLVSAFGKILHLVH